MEINSIDAPRHLIEADIIEPFEARPHDLPHPMVRHEEFFLPPHEHVLPIRAVLIVKVGFLGLLREGPPGGKASPMPHVFFVARAPVGVSGLERVFGADYFAFEKCG